MIEPVSGATPTPSERSALQDLLTAERASTAGQIEALTRDLGDIIEASTSVATDDEHDPEGATIAFERAQVTALLNRARERLVDLDRALERLSEGTYGACERCGQPIGAERLAARPASRTCIACASARRR
jgi:RNA polymerase-binding protein DksA